MNFEDLINDLKKFDPAEIVFVGLGNEHRGDDAAGLVFLNMLRTSKSFTKSYFINAGTNPENYLAEILLQEPSAVVFIDSVQSSKQGSIDWIEIEQIDSLHISTHAFSIGLIAEYLQKYMPMEIRILGIYIESGSFSHRISRETLESINMFFGSS